MKYTNTLLVHLCTVLTFVACTKDDQSALTIDSPGKANKHAGDFKAKDFRLKTIKNTITFPPYLSKNPVEESYELIYNNRGNIERIKIITKNDDFDWEYSYLAHFKGARMDSISGYSISGSGPLFSGIKYRGNHIVEVLFHYSPLMPQKKTFEYDHKGRLLNGLNGFPFIYDESGLLIRIVYPIEHFNESFRYEETYNPMFIENLHLFFTYSSLSKLCYSQWNISAKFQAQEVSIHKNSYDDRGRLKTKNYSEMQPTR